MSATAIDKNKITSPAHHEVGELKKKPEITGLLLKLFPSTDHAT